MGLFVLPHIQAQLDAESGNKGTFTVAFEPDTVINVLYISQDDEVIGTASGITKKGRKFVLPKGDYTAALRFHAESGTQGKLTITQPDGTVRSRTGKVAKPNKSRTLRRTFSV